jgi:peptidoglycan hydrolase-like protein with peptidoglycan-binding domain
LIEDETRPDKLALNNPRFSENSELIAAAENTPALKKGATGEAVTILQQALIDLGFSMPKSTRAKGGLPDGSYGDETEATVSSFQRSNGLQVDGRVGRETLKLLEESIRALSEVEQAKFEAEFRLESRKGERFG